MITLMGRGRAAVPGWSMATLGAGWSDSCAPMTTSVNATTKKITVTTTGAREMRGAPAGCGEVTARLYRGPGRSAHAGGSAVDRARPRRVVHDGITRLPTA